MRLTLARIATRASVRSGRDSTFPMGFLHHSTQRDTLATHIELVEPMGADNETDEELVPLKQCYAAHGQGEALKAHLHLSGPDQYTFTASRAAQIS
jgi:hypothetical protein